MIRIYIENDRLIVRAEQGDLAPRHESQLAFWGFKFEVTSGCFVAPPGEVGPLVQKVTAFLERCGRICELEAPIGSLLLEREAAQVALAAALAGGAQFKNGDTRPSWHESVRRFLRSRSSSQTQGAPAENGVTSPFCPERRLLLCSRKW